MSRQGRVRAKYPEVFVALRGFAHSLVRMHELLDSPYFQEQYPYFRRNPIKWIRRWWINFRTRKQRSAALDNMAAQVSYYRCKGESDVDFRARISHGLKHYEGI